MRRGTLGGETVEILDAIPDLEDSLPPERALLARRHLRAQTMTMRRGRWHADLDVAMVQDGLGFLILEGALVRCVTAAHRTAGELLGPGDLVGLDSGDRLVPPFSGYWRVVEQTRVAILDARVARAAMCLPELIPVLVAAQIRRAGTLSNQLVIAQSQSVEARAVVLLEHLAERWGRVTPEGVILPSFLSHGTLALLLGARRPSVTSALVRLSARGVVQRRIDGRWLLPAGATAAAEPIAA